jgi:5'-nucleotidase
MKQLIFYSLAEAAIGIKSTSLNQFLLFFYADIIKLAPATVGAAMEAASQGIPALAASLETDRAHHLSYSTDIDFSAAAYFTAFFARKMLEKQFPSEVDLLKVDVPSNATRQTDWQVTRLARQRYFIPVAPKRKSWEERGPVDYQEAANLEGEREDSDVYVLRVKRLVSLTPLSLDFTARVDFEELNRLLRFDD